nr:Retrovirus-related Pol polyprotein from transposon TNT 1-94 [Ipomoea batatas]
MAWRSPAINMVRQSTQLGGNENQAGAANHPPNPIPIPIPIPAVDQAVFDPNDRKNPLYLHPNESPALQLVSVQLEGRSNYHPWARAMEMALRSNNKMSIVNGTMVIPNTTDARVFGCLTFAAVPSCHRSKFSPRARKCVFLGFANGIKGYKLFDTHTKEVFMSRDVSFYENLFPFQMLQSKQPDMLVLPSESISYPDIDDHISIPTAEHNSHEDQHVVPSQTNEVSNTNVTTVHQPRRSARNSTHASSVVNERFNDPAGGWGSPGSEDEKFEVFFDACKAATPILLYSQQYYGYLTNFSQVQLAGRNLLLASETSTGRNCS